MCRDNQKSRVYAWEDRAIPRGRLIPYEEIPAYVARIWAAEGREHPPLVKPLAPQERRAAGKGNRDAVLFPKTGATEHVILHELAHAMTSTVDGACDLHGPHFVTALMQLSSKHLQGCNLFALWYSAEKEGIEFHKKW